MTNRNRATDNVVLWLLAAASVAALLARGCDAEAQDNRARLTPALALARLCVSEAGWDCFTTGDGLAIHEVMLRGSARQSLRYETFARSYARRLFGARQHDLPRLRWVGQLNSRGDAPPSWPATVSRSVGGVVRVGPHAPWSNYRARWLAVLAQATEVVEAHTLDDADEWGICDRAVHDWGGWMDRSRAERIGLVPVPCNVGPDERTHNDFYCRPSVDPTCRAQ